MNKTENFGLGKPEEEEFYDIGIQNGNMDILDEKLADALERMDTYYGQLIAYTDKAVDDLNSSLNTVLTKSLEHKQDLSTAVNTGNIAEHLLEKIYPVGSVYISTTPVSPASFLGGTWTQIKDRFLLGAGGSYANGATGGEASHTLTEAEMPRHRHTLYCAHKKDFAVQPAATGAQGFNADTSGTSYAGGNAAHNNMPPYLAVHMWTRTA